MSAASKLIGQPLSALDTPALVVEMPVMMRNLARIADACRAAGVQWRPHCKTHKSPAIALMQLSHGACGITCAKLAEAEVMVAAGITDILIANQIVGPLKIARLLALRQAGATLAVAVDNAGNVTDLAQAAAAAGVTLEVMIEVDTGTQRAGVEPGEPVLRLARHIADSPALRLRGVMTWEGHTTRIADAQQKRAAITAAVALLTDSADLCRRHGIAVPEVSCGGTGTYRTAATLPGVTEIQAGGGIFGDVHYRELYHVPVEYALTLLTTITSRPTPTRIICDAGKKALSCDAGIPIPLELPLVQSVGFSAEHGKVELAAPSALPAVGDRLRWVVGYGDTSVHLHDRIYGIQDGVIVTEWAIPSGSRLR
ncbi:Alanine racemase domain-containing protein [Sodalis praecaptivus]|uniref:Alanine racemase domain-containing protein n=1 Tax=Sodalis praecaptivus TaxID=1239307 RepID=W0HWL7_9GAMM|nr:DSD1 family PLP-dependent enzyme [Sodalis praecaptivus]AHF76590.1 Alanine racemase domain-containing protein [Sodalis praecaptivus]